MRRRMPRRLYGAPVLNGTTGGCGCGGLGSLSVAGSCSSARKNGDDLTPLIGIGAIALIGIVGWVITKPERDAKIAKDLAVAQALREGKVDNLSLAQTEANVTGYGMSF